MSNRVEEIASKAMGKAKGAKARIKGMKGIFKTLSEEHGEVSALLMRVSKSSDPEVREELFPEIEKNLLAHERGEVSELYPVLRQHDETRQMAEDHDEEANEMESLLAALRRQDVDSERWEELFDQLVELVQHHVREEENEYFPSAQDVLGDEQVEELDDSYLARKKSIMETL